MKIFVTGTRGIPDILGGVETHCQELFPRIAEMGFDITIIRRKSYVKDTMTEYKNVRLIDIETPKKKSFEAIVHTFKAILEAKFQKADIVHIHAIGPALLVPIARLLGIKVVFTHHGPDYDRDKWGKFAKWILRMGEKTGMYYANHIIVISEHIRRMIQQKYPDKKNITLIYNGINPVFPARSTEHLQSLDLTEYGYILAVGRLVKEKGFDKLIEAFKQLSPVSIKLVIAGDADYQDEYTQKLKEMCKEQKNIRLVGFIKGEKLAQLYTYARIFVLPSTHEGLPIALLEAMSYNCPVLASDIPANKEIGLPEECYFKSGDLSCLQQALKKQLENAQTERVSYNLSAYNWTNIAGQTKEIYNSLIL